MFNFARIRIVLVSSILAAGSIFVGELISPSYVSAGNASDVCSGLSRAAKGLCNAAVTVGCGDIYDQPPSCEQTEAHYRAITNQDPPWIPAGCPCGDRELFVNSINQWIEGGLSLGAISIDRFVLAYGPNCEMFGSTYPGLIPDDKILGPVCGISGLPLVYDITDEEAESCVYQMVSAMKTAGIWIDESQEAVIPLCAVPDPVFPGEYMGQP
jgi:hypothetical protein